MTSHPHEKECCTVLHPFIILDSSDSEYYDDESDYGIWYFEGGVEELKFRAYAGGTEDVSTYWPPSPSLLGLNNSHFTY